ncbi:MAG: TonB system transport protein ExbD [Halarcobacter sp.]
MKIKKFDSINIIPFIDVLLVLLAIVLMTSTFIAKGVIPISLPEARSAEDMKAKKEVSIFIKKDGTIYLNKTFVLKEELKSKLQLLNKENPILINSDKEAKFDTFVTIFDLLKENGFKNISIVTLK